MPSSSSPTSDRDPDTEPLQTVSQAAPFPAGWPAGNPATADTVTAATPGPSWPRFEELPAVTSRRVRRKRGRIVLVGAATVVTVAAVAGLVLWNRSGSPESRAARSPAATTTAPAPSTTTAPADPVAQARLFTLIPPGYAPGVCTAVNPPAEALAKVSCGNNTDVGGPSTASYLLARDKAALQAAFDDTVQSIGVVVCPGNIQSPGPWRRNATPQVSAGTLVCGVRQNHKTVAWTTDAETMLSVVQSEAAGPALDQLYAWWSSHS